MNRENKRKSFDKNYYKTHSCNESFVCKVCGRNALPSVPTVITGIIVRIAFRVNISTSSRAIEARIAAA